MVPLVTMALSATFKAGPVFLYKLRYIVGFSTNPKPTIYRNWYENTGIEAQHGVTMRLSCIHFTQTVGVLLDAVSCGAKWNLSSGMAAGCCDDEITIHEHVSLHCLAAGTQLGGIAETKTH